MTCSIKSTNPRGSQGMCLDCVVKSLSNVGPFRCTALIQNVGPVCGSAGGGVNPQFRPPQLTPLLSLSLQPSFPSSVHHQQHFPLAPLLPQDTFGLSPSPVTLPSYCFSSCFPLVSTFFGHYFTRQQFSFHAFSTKLKKGECLMMSSYNLWKSSDSSSPDSSQFSHWSIL